MQPLPHLRENFRKAAPAAKKAGRRGTLRVASGVGCALFTFVLAAFFLAACDPELEWKYYKDGIGTELTTQNLRSPADLQDAYIYELCRQARGVQTATAGSEPIGGGARPCVLVDRIPAGSRSFSAIDHNALVARS
jgi:hypothetical protein